MAENSGKSEEDEEVGIFQYIYSSTQFKPLPFVPDRRAMFKHFGSGFDIGTTDADGGSWWGSWMASAKEKTEKALAMVSSDIAEFTSTMQTDTKKAVEKTKETLQQQTNVTANATVTDKMASSFHTLMDGITRALTVEPEDTTPAKSHMPQPATGIFDRAKARLRAIQVDTGTYLSEPSGPPELYAEWLKTFNLDNYKGEVSDLLVTMVEVRSLYTTLVPSEVSHQDFWRRYFYKIHQLDKDEARKQALMKRAENTKEDSISWDEEGWSGDEESGSPETSSQRTKPPSNKDPVETSPAKDKEIQSGTNQEDATSRLKPDITESVKPDEKDIKDSKSEQNFDTEKDTPVIDNTTIKESKKDDGTKSKGKEKNIAQEISDTSKVTADNSSDFVKSEHESIDSKTEDNSLTGKNTTDSAEIGNNDLSTNEMTTNDTLKDCDTNSKDNVGKEEKAEVCDIAKGSGETEYKTKVKGDMVMVGDSDRTSPTSDSSGTKESSTDDWEKDFDVDISPEDLAAASELAQKLNSSATDYATLTGTEDDWESWE